MAYFRLGFSILILFSLSLKICAETKLPLGPMPISLNNLPIPEVPGLLDGEDPVVVDKETAIILGKALFWDVNVGSDGMACASCHFHAGVDRRIKNQLAPGGQTASLTKQRLKDYFANRSLVQADFPFFKLKDPLQERSGVQQETGFVTGSSGTYKGEFKNSGTGDMPYEDCVREVNSVFHVGTVATRQVTPRNAPSVINAVFNHRSFWDGRANNIFNGSSSWGDRDPDAGVWVVDHANRIFKKRLKLANSSLASLATAPPLNTTEMSCSKRTFHHIGRKLISRRPLSRQKVHWHDSVLGKLSFSSEQKLKQGLDTTYEALIKKAFNKKYWSYQDVGKFGRPIQGSPYRQIEANFAMFFGLAIQLYESTLVSGQSKFDQSRRDENNIPVDLTESELNGLEQFRINLCSHCHLGPNFTSASVAANAVLAKNKPEVYGEHANKVSTTSNVVSRIPVLIGKKALTVFSDTGFSSTGVAELESDTGLGALDIFGNPLSFSQQYLQFLSGNVKEVKDDAVRHVRPCDFPEPFAVNFKPYYVAINLFTIEDGVEPQSQNTKDCFLPADKNAFVPTRAAALKELSSPDNRRMLSEVNGSFKIPSLRNIELTGPYMHDGSMSTLEQVIEFYARGGNYNHDAKEITLVFPLPRFKFSEQNRNDLIAFLKTLTDDRVRYQKAPFDHPELVIPSGHDGDANQVLPDSRYPNLAKDLFLTIPAVGTNGSKTPLQSFENYLADN